MRNLPFRRTQRPKSNKLIPCKTNSGPPAALTGEGIKLPCIFEAVREIYRNIFSLASFEKVDLFRSEIQLAGHTVRGPIRCINCGGSHSGQCINPSNCTNCKGDHLANSPNCPTSKRKKAAAPTENNTSDNTTNVPKSLVKRDFGAKRRLLTRMDLNYHRRNRPLSLMDIRVKDDLESDHLPVILTLYTGSALIKIPDQLSTNWENFKFLLNNKPLPIPPSSSNDNL
ncbi:hypothetical protein TNCV_4663941 [Trichonephila clavipes]|uniref:Uncharacterized protein n=1 Tax=Trichonephila clavipes TaxID=2585209 RepID=A0A8X6VJ59_TRICX|nr:hypothetical protein TNCV_4663941 [Trichonephila clavipes]